MAQQKTKKWVDIQHTQLLLKHISDFCATHLCIHNRQVLSCLPSLEIQRRNSTYLEEEGHNILLTTVYNLKVTIGLQENTKK